MRLEHEQEGSWHHVLDIWQIAAYQLKQLGGTQRERLLVVYYLSACLRFPLGSEAKNVRASFPNHDHMLFSPCKHLPRLRDPTWFDIRPSLCFFLLNKPDTTATQHSAFPPRSSALSPLTSCSPDEPAPRR